MKPEDLVPPYPRHDQRTAICDRVWYVPVRESVPSDFIFPGWSHPDLFGNDNPVYVEYCSGNGAWIADRALCYPEFNWVAVERKFDRVRKLWSKVHNLKLKNLIVLCGEAHHATKKYFPDSSVEHIYINFPDPWPKRRHEDNRLIQPAFLQESWRTLHPAGKMTFVTDDSPYSTWFIRAMHKDGRFVSQYPEPYYRTDLENYGTSYFEELWRTKGRVIYYHSYHKQ